LRFVDKKTEQDAGDERTAVERDQRAAEQCSGEKSVLTVPDIDQNRREGEREEEPLQCHSGSREAAVRDPYPPGPKAIAEYSCFGFCGYGFRARALRAPE